jgi:integrase
MDALRQSPVVDASQPVLRGNPSAAEICDVLAEGVRRSMPDDGCRVKRLRFNDAMRGIERLREFLSANGSADLNEQTLSDFRAHLLSSGLVPVSVGDLVRQVRRAVNSLPPTHLNRPLLDGKAHQKATRLDGLSKETASILRAFHQSGCRIRKGSATVKPLSPCYRENVVGATIRFLKLVGKADLREITNTDVEQCLRSYEQREQRNTGVDLLATVCALFRHMMAKGLTDKNPFAQCTEKIVTTDDDFVTQTGIAQLGDLSSLEMRSFQDVRNRMIAFALCYDFALRIGEAVRLDVGDFALDDLVGLTLRPEVQKGMSKSAVLLHNYFAESKVLIEAYLKLRQAMKPRDNAFLIADDGARLGEGGGRDAVVRGCKAVGASTYKQGNPLPHRLRHSFGTLNIEPLGLSLSAWEVSARLRHQNLKTTMDTYVTKNPLLQKARHIARLQRSKETNGFAQQVATSGAGADDFTMSESEAVAAMMALGIPRHSLRKFCAARSWGRAAAGSWVYSKSAVADLARNWMTKQRAIKLLELSNSGFYFWVKENSIPTMTIGKACLIRIESVLPKLERKSA